MISRKSIKDDQNTNNYLKFITCIILVSVLFVPVIIQLVNVWVTNGDYSHGFLVVPIVGWIIWARREKLLLLSVKSSWIGLPVLMIGMAAYLISFIVNFKTLNYLSMIIIILGLLLFLTGWIITKELLFPVLFLIFMFPIPSAYYIMITNPLKLFLTAQFKN
ncbi:exosortase/archaeosortase family protein [Thermodesulfobacteriota bacterium]